MHLCFKNFLKTFETYSSSVTSKWSPNKLVVLQQQRCIETTVRSSHSEVFLGKGVLKICSKFTGEHPCRSMISIKLLCFIEITLRHKCSPVNLLHIFRTPFLKNASGWLLLILSKANWRILTIVSMSVVFCRRCLIGLNLKILLFIFCVVTKKGTFPANICWS